MWLALQDVALEMDVVVNEFASDQNFAGTADILTRETAVELSK